MADDEELIPGTLVVGRYQVVTLLGEGSVKRVYLAFDRLAQSQVALCLLRPEFGPDTQVGARFSREGRAAAALMSPFVVRVFDVGRTAKGTRYLVTEAVKGRGLDSALAYGAVPPRHAALWTAQVLAGLEEAHRRGIVHRDVKPENVMLARGEGAIETAKLTDFGLARVADPALQGSVHLATTQGVVMGTPDYMPPEQWGHGTPDPRADLYAVGVMLHEMLLGYVPFRGQTLRETAALHVSAPLPPFPDDVTEDVRAFEPVVRRAMQKSPDDRYPSAEAMRAEVQRIGRFEVPAPPTMVVGAPDETDEGVARVELANDLGLPAVQLVAAPRVVLGRVSAVVARCVPPTEENERRTRTVSRRHARIEWRGGYAWVDDLGSASGTSVNGARVPPGGGGVRLRSGDELSLGPHVRYVFEHAAATEGELPAWARLTRVDRYGAGVSHVFVLLEAELSGRADAAIPVPPDAAGEGVLRFRARAGRIVALRPGDEDPIELREGMPLPLGRGTWTVALEQR